MLCFRYKKLLMPYVENALDDRSRSRVMRHVARCKRCADELHSLESMSKALSHVDVPSADPATDLWAKVSARIADESISSVPYRRSWVPQIAGAGIAVLIITGYAMIRPIDNLGNIKSSSSARVIATAPAQPHELGAKSVEPNAAGSIRRLATKPHRNKPIMMAKLPEEISSGIVGKIAEKVADIKMETKIIASDSPAAKSSAQRPPNIEPSPESQVARVAEAAPSANVGFLDSNYMYKDNAEKNSPPPAPMASKAASGICCDSAKSAQINHLSEQDQLSECERTGNYVAMLETAKKMLETDPNNPYYLLKLGDAYEHCGKTQEARAAYEKVASGADSKYAPVAKSRLADMKSK